MYNIIICDDDAGYIKELVSLIHRSNDRKRELNIQKCTSGEELIKCIDDSFDAVFLDVQTSCMDGKVTAQKLRESGYSGLLILCSGIYVPTSEIIKLLPYRYIEKYDKKETILKYINDVFDKLDKIKTYAIIEASYNRERVLIKTSSIIYITHHQKGSIIHLSYCAKNRYSEGKLITSFKFNVLLEKLRLIGFAIPHNSYLVNMNYVTDWDFNVGYIIVDDHRIPVSNSRSDVFKNELRDYLRVKFQREM